MSDLNRYIDPHDAVVEDIRVRLSGDVDISFAHMNVFERVADERYEVWSYRAVLRCRQVTSLEMIDLRSADAWVSDLSFQGVEQGRPMNRAELPTPVDGFELTFDNGATIRIACASVCWRLTTRVKRLETWEGPLQS